MKTIFRYFSFLTIFWLGMTSSVLADDMMMARINQDFPEAMLKLQEAITNQGYTVSRVQRVDIGLTKSGYKTDKYRVVFYGKPAEIDHISKNYPELTPYLPLKIAIFAEAGDTMIVAANPIILAPQASKELTQQLSIWESDLQKLLRTMQTASD